MIKQKPMDYDRLSRSMGCWRPDNYGLTADSFC
jgi:hypothetical protein